MAARAEACGGNHPGQKARAVVTLRPGFAKALVLKPFQTGDPGVCPGFYLPCVIPLLFQHWHLKHSPCSTGCGRLARVWGVRTWLTGALAICPVLRLCLSPGAEEGEIWHHSQLQP